MGCGTSFVKYVLFFFNLLVSLLGIVLIAIGVVFVVNWKVVKDELQSHLTVAPWVFIIIGAVMFTIAFFGCCGAIRESHCMVVTYAIFLLIIIIVQVALAILMFVYGDNIKSSIAKSVDTLFDKRSGPTVDKATESLINNLQQQFQCCGKNGANYYGITGVANLPPSCCDPQFLGVEGLCTALNSYEGCSTVIPRKYDDWNKPIAGVAIGVACVEVVGALFALYLANSIRNMDRRSRY